MELYDSKEIEESQIKKIEVPCSEECRDSNTVEKDKFKGQKK
jgi:hypothetical protein